MKLSVVLGSYNRKDFLKETIYSIRKELLNCNFKSEIIIVDGGSQDGTLKWLIKQKDIITVVQHNRGTWQGKKIEKKTWGYFMNLGFKIAQGKYLLMISDDCLIVPNAINNGVKLFEEKLKQKEKIGGIAFYWRNWPEDKYYFVGKTLGDKMVINHGLYLTKALKEVDYLDEKIINFYYGDGDLSLKIWNAGYKIIDCPTSFIEHCYHLNLKLRKGNEQTEKNDWQNYISKWNKTFYKNKFKGSWQKIVFEDRAKTYRNFFKAFTIKNYFIYFILILRKYLKNHHYPLYQKMEKFNPYKTSLK